VGDAGVPSADQRSPTAPTAAAAATAAGAAATGPDEVGRAQADPAPAVRAITGSGADTDAAAGRTADPSGSATAAATAATAATDGDPARPERVAVDGHDADHRLAGPGGRSGHGRGQPSAVVALTLPSRGRCSS
jgi:hypothetical protein